MSGISLHTSLPSRHQIIYKCRVTHRRISTPFPSNLHIKVRIKYKRLITDHYRVKELGQKRVDSAFLQVLASKLGETFSCRARTIRSFVSSSSRKHSKRDMVFPILQFNRVIDFKSRQNLNEVRKRCRETFSSWRKAQQDSLSGGDYMISKMRRNLAV